MIVFLDIKILKLLTLEKKCAHFSKSEFSVNLSSRKKQNNFESKVNFPSFYRVFRNSVHIYIIISAIILFTLLIPAFACLFCNCFDIKTFI